MSFYPKGFLTLAAFCSLAVIALVGIASRRDSTTVANVPVPASTAVGSVALAAQSAPVKAKPVPAELPVVVASVDGEAITRDEFENALRAYEQRAGGAIPPEQRDDVLRGVLDQLIGYHVLEQEARQRGITVSDADLDARIRELRQGFPTEAAFTQALTAQGMTPDKLRAVVRNDLQVPRLISGEIDSKVAVQPQDVSAFYTQNPDAFKQGEQVRASHILLMVPATADAATRQRLRAKAESLVLGARAGQDFAALARTNSQDGSAKAGGDLGVFGRGQMVPPFEAAAFALKPGEISDVVETQFGFHVIKVAEHIPARAVPFDEVKEKIAAFLSDKQRQEKTATFVDELKAKHKIEILM